MPNELGVVRRSALVSPHGPGAIVDFRARGGPVSAIIAGLDEWDRSSPAGLLHPQVTYEPRLQASLNVQGFRLPPVSASDSPRPSEQLVAVRFPTWLLCPGCSRLRRARRWGSDPGSAARYCGECTARREARGRSFVVPARFVVACSSGHLDDFPWHWWVAHRAECTNRDGDLLLESRGMGLAGLVVVCKTCSASRSMDGVFGARALESLTCSGNRPWLAAERELCSKPVRTLQRGASNLYFPVTRSSLDIPPWSDHLQAALGMYWEPLRSTDAAGRRQLIAALWNLFEQLGYSRDQLADAIEERLTDLESQQDAGLREEEYRQFTSEVPTGAEDIREFECRPQIVPAGLREHVQVIAEAVRLREVRALIGFTRVNPPGTREAGVEIPLAPIQSTRRNWLPAIEVRGEGVFLALKPDAVSRWEASSAVRSRAESVHFDPRGDGSDPQITPDNIARAMLVHTLAHVLMRQLALDCGYSAASLRERLYVGTPLDRCAGVLIYTSSPDADGTLGGLSRQGKPDRMEALLIRAVASCQWCSSDPLCMSGAMSHSGTSNLAACHCCALAPETSCELFNSLLDRAMLIGTPQQPDVGFFQNLVKG